MLDNCYTLIAIPVLLAASRIVIALHPAPALPSEENTEEGTQPNHPAGDALISEEDARSILQSAAKSAGNDISFVSWSIVIYNAINLIT